jgi:amino acid transporter
MVFFGLRYAGGWLIGIIALFFISLGIIVVNISNPEIVLNHYYFILFGVVSYLICYFLVFKNDAYLKYFDEFKNWTIAEKRKNVLLSVGFIIGVITLSFSSLLYFN